MTARRPDMPSQANDPLVLHAWVDESIRVAGPGEGLYVLAAAVTHVRCEAIRGDLRQLLLKGQRRLHWRDEGSSRRRKISERIAGLDIAAVVVVGTHVARKKQERARRICLKRLLHELGQLGVECVWLEERTKSLNSKDHQMVIALRRSRTISSRLRVEHARPLEEEMLWLPDAVAGAVQAARAGNSEYLTVIHQVVTEININVR